MDEHTPPEPQQAEHPEAQQREIGEAQVKFLAAGGLDAVSEVMDALGFDEAANMAEDAATAARTSAYLDLIEAGPGRTPLRIRSRRSSRQGGRRRPLVCMNERPQARLIAETPDAQPDAWPTH